MALIAVELLRQGELIAQLRHCLEQCGIRPVIDKLPINISLHQRFCQPYREEHVSKSQVAIIEEHRSVISLYEFRFAGATAQPTRDFGISPVNYPG